MMIRSDVRKSVQYKYIKYKFMRKCLANEALQKLSEDEKEKILIEAAKKTRKITWIIIMIYIPVMIYFTYGLVFNYKYMDNAFIKWLIGIYESVFPLINGNWGSALHEKKGTFLMIFIKLLPAFIIQSLPLFIPVVITANIILEKEIYSRGI